jgi:hypothetical protein
MEKHRGNQQVQGRRREEGKKGLRRKVLGYH